MKFSLEITQGNIRKNLYIPEETKFLTVPDNPFGKPGPSSVPMAYILKKKYGKKAIATINTRDRNKIGIISEVLAALELDLDGIFVVNGDSVKKSMEVREINVFEVISLIKNLRYEYGSEMVIGATINLSRENEYKIVKRKLDSGADFFITQTVYSDEFFYNNKWIKYLSVPVYIGFMPLLSKKLLPFYYKNLTVPKELYFKFLDSTNLMNDNVKLFQQIFKKTMDYVDGYHIMPLNNIDFVLEMKRKVKEW